MKNCQICTFLDPPCNEVSLGQNISQICSLNDVSSPDEIPLSRFSISKVEKVRGTEGNCFKIRYSTKIFGLHCFEGDEIYFFKVRLLLHNVDTNLFFFTHCINLVFVFGFSDLSNSHLIVHQIRVNKSPEIDPSLGPSKQGGTAWPTLAQFQSLRIWI